MKTKLCILFGGASSEYEVSLNSSYSVLKNADPEKYDLVTVGITKAGKWYLFEGDYDLIPQNKWTEGKVTPVTFSLSKGDNALLTEDGRKISVDVVFPVMHGANCEDGTLQGMLTLAGIPFVGPGCRASAVSMDKATTKLYLNGFGIPQAKALIITKRDFETEFAKITEDAEKLSYPLFVKPCGTGSSVGVSRVEKESDLKIALTEALKFDSKVLVEEYMRGKEVEVAVMGNEDPIAPTCGEIDPGAVFYDYDTKYNNDTASYYIPAKISEKAQTEVRALAVKIYKALGCTGLSRVDFFVDGDRITFNEINTLPGFTNISMYPKIMMASGMTYAEVIDALVSCALKDKR